MEENPGELCNSQAANQTPAEETADRREEECHVEECTFTYNSVELVHVNEGVFGISGLDQIPGRRLIRSSSFAPLKQVTGLCK